MPALTPSRVLRSAADTAKNVNWSATLNLPSSPFPARASLAQLQQYRQRCADDLYAWQQSQRPLHDTFVLHDGPPYANGAVHVGHALNKVLKDLILRWELARGRRVHYQPGWDCHGLPIELKALQQTNSPQPQAKVLEDAPKQEAGPAAGMGLTAAEVRAKARQLASETVNVQMKSFREWGVMGEWTRPYKTMDQDFEIRQLRVFKEMVKKGLISRHRRPVFWSPSSRTALAEAELEHDDNHECTAAFIKMPFATLPTVLEQLEPLRPGNVAALIWTTTPWTLPANQAIAVHDDIEYCLLHLQTPRASSPGASSDAGEYFVIAAARVDHVLSHLPRSVVAKVIHSRISGSQIADGRATCWNVLRGEQSPIVNADFVTAASGTGLVHMAPGHGMEDYQVCEAHGITTVLAPVDDEGRYNEDVAPASGPALVQKLRGLDVQTDGVKAVLAILQSPDSDIARNHWSSGSSLVLRSHRFVHKNPIDWRTKQPVIVRATAQWFADASALQKPALRSLDQVTFIPESGKSRLSAFLSGRSRWCISRQRAWGVPIPALYHKTTGEACIMETSIDHIISALQARGTDAWFKDPEDEPAWLCPELDATEWIRGKDTMDVWFDSGTTWTSLEQRNNERPVADVYSEGTDQHRGWFQSSLLTYVASQDGTKTHAPFAKLITHGFTLDAEGRKMSKSLGNVISPEQIIDGSLLPPIKTKKQKIGKKNSIGVDNAQEAKYDSLGPDVLRLWVASSDYTRDVTVAIPVLQDVQNTLQKYRVTVKWLLGVLNNYQPLPNGIQAHRDDLTFADYAILHRLASVSAAVYNDYGEYAFHKAMKEIATFVNSDLSAFYFEICKDTLYTGFAAERTRVQTVLAEILRELLRMLGPPLPHLVEEAWEYMPPTLKETEEHPLKLVWMSPYSAPSPQGNSHEEVDQRLRFFERLSAAVKLAQEEARRAGKVKSGLACSVEIAFPDHGENDMSRAVRQWAARDELADLLVVSQATIVEWADMEGRDEVPWCFEQTVYADSDKSSTPVCVLAVLPPKGEKCVRCWKYTAEDKDTVCQRCQAVVAEKNGST